MRQADYLKRRRGAARALALVGVLGLALAGCAETVSVRGNIPTEENLSRITPGIHSRSDVARLLGTPSTISTFEDSKWYYIGQKTSEFAFFEPEVLERKVVVVSFDDTGTVDRTKTYDLKDGQEIEPVDRITPTEGREFTFIQQLIGNLGRFTSSGADQ